jgi:nuclear pore complex protein Nup155
MMCIEGTPDGRLFLGGKDGSLYEVTYQARDGWFSKRCQLINHSISHLSFLIPSFLSFTEEGEAVSIHAGPHGETQSVSQ